MVIDLQGDCRKFHKSCIVVQKDYLSQCKSSRIPLLIRKSVVRWCQIFLLDERGVGMR